MSLAIAPVTAPVGPDGEALSLRAQNDLARQLAAGALPMLLEAYLAQALTSPDVETKGKAVDRVSKITRLVDDANASLPTINVVFSGTAFSAQVTAAAPAIDVPAREVPLTALAPLAAAVMVPPAPAAAVEDDGWACALLGAEDE